MIDMEKLFIDNEDIKLEAEYFESSTDQTSAVLVAHPHPQYGGNMYNNVVSAVFNIFMSNDVSCLRFNFRAVGNSTGTHSSGRGELSDVKACIDYLINNKNVEKVFICGYSYGAAIGCSTVNHSEKVIGYASISFPWDFIGPRYKKLSQANKPKLFIQGDRDDIANFNNFQEHYASYSDPKESMIIKGADHFYGGYERQAAEEVFRFYKSIK